MSDNTSAVVLLSGGQDSTTCLAWAVDRFSTLYSIAFDYGQRHRVELDAAKAIAERAGVTEHRVVTVSALAELGGTTLLGDDPSPDLGQLGTMGKGDLPNTFVPGRNLVFLSLAAAWAWQLGVHDLVTGVCETDYSGLSRLPSVNDNGDAGCFGGWLGCAGDGAHATDVVIESADRVDVE